VSQDRDVTRHAEAVALTEAQRTLGCTSLDDCTLYANVEPCALCSYAIREARIGRVVYGVSSPVMGGHPRNGSCKPIKWYNLLNSLVFPTKISNAEQLTTVQQFQ